ncbi:MAG: hypothetical protein L0241_22485 [Planctomycetia bacterium]|nr:hypothetical protein [Planctomycetia bacterium]
MPAPAYFQAMLIGYLLTIAIETTVLLLLLSRRHSRRVRIFAGVWLTACTYPIVWIVLPPLFEPEQRWLFLLVAETFAPVAECVIFWLAFIRRRDDAPSTSEEETIPPDQPPSGRATLRDFAAITLANLCSFGLGEWLNARGFWNLVMS